MSPETALQSLTALECGRITQPHDLHLLEETLLVKLICLPVAFLIAASQAPAQSGIGILNAGQAGNLSWCPWAIDLAGLPSCAIDQGPGGGMLGSASTTGSDGRIYVAGGGWPGSYRGPLPSWTLASPEGGWISTAPGPFWPLSAALPTDAVASYDPLAHVWRGEPSMNIARVRHELATGIDGRLYAFGGDDAGTIESYDTTTQVWTLVGSLPAGPTSWVGPRNMAVTTDRDGSFIVIGGGDSLTSSRFAHRWQWDPIAAQYTTWTQLPSLNFPRKGHRALTGSDGVVHVICEDQQIERIDLTATAPSWTLGMSIDAPDIGFGAAATPNGRFLLGGGRYHYGSGFDPGNRYFYSQQPFDALWSFTDPATSAYYPRLSARKSFLSLSIAEGSVFAFGGALAASPCNAVNNEWTWADQVESFGAFPARMMSGLTSLWRFDEHVPDQTLYAIDSITGDQAIYSGTETVSGRVTMGPGPGSAEFNGAPAWNNDYNPVSNPLHCNVGAGSFTIECWVRSPHLPTTKTILDKRSGLESAPTGFSMYLKPNNRLGFQLASSGWQNTETDVSFAASTWTHCAVVVKRPTVGASSVTLYVNGAQVKHRARALLGDTSNTTPLWIGRHKYNGSGYQGRLDELSFYNRALSWHELRSVFLAGRLGKR